MPSTAVVVNIPGVEVQISNIIERAVNEAAAHGLTKGRSPYMIELAVRNLRELGWKDARLAMKVCDTKEILMASFTERFNETYTQAIGLVE